MGRCFPGGRIRPRGISLIVDDDDDDDADNYKQHNLLRVQQKCNTYVLVSTKVSSSRKLLKACVCTYFLRGWHKKLTSKLTVAGKPGFRIGSKPLLDVTNSIPKEKDAVFNRNHVKNERPTLRVLSTNISKNISCFVLFYAPRKSVKRIKYPVGNLLI